MTVEDPSARGIDASARGGEEESLTHSRASRSSDPEEPASEAEAAFGGPVTVPGDLDAFDF